MNFSAIVTLSASFLLFIACDEKAAPTSPVVSSPVMSSSIVSSIPVSSNDTLTPTPSSVATIVTSSPSSTGTIVTPSSSSQIIVDSLSSSSSTPIVTPSSVGQDTTPSSSSIVTPSSSSSAPLPSSSTISSSQVSSSSEAIVVVQRNLTEEWDFTILETKNNASTFFKAWDAAQDADGYYVTGKVAVSAPTLKNSLFKSRLDLSDTSVFTSLYGNYGYYIGDVYGDAVKPSKGTAICITDEGPVYFGTDNNGMFIDIPSRGSAFSQTHLTIANAAYRDPYRIIETDDKGFVIAGLITSQPSDVFVIKIDSLFAIEWEHTVSTPGTNDGVIGITKSEDGGYVYTSFTYSGVYGQVETPRITKLSSTGQVVWNVTFDSITPDLIGDIKLVNDKYIVIGTSTSSYTSYMFALDLNGNVLWEKDMVVSIGNLNKLVNGNYVVFSSDNVIEFDSSWNSIASTPHVHTGSKTIRTTSDGGFMILYTDGDFVKLKKFTYTP